MQHTVRWADVMLHSLLLFHKEIICFLVYKITTSCSEFKSRIIMFQKKKKERKRKQNSRYSLRPYTWNKEITLQTLLLHPLAETGSPCQQSFSFKFACSEIQKDCMNQVRSLLSMHSMLLIRHSFGHRSNNCELAFPTTATNQWMDACTQKTSLRRENKIA